MLVCAGADICPCVWMSLTCPGCGCDRGQPLVKLSLIDVISKQLHSHFMRDITRSGGSL